MRATAADSLAATPLRAIEAPPFEAAAEGVDSPVVAAGPSRVRLCIRPLTTVDLPRLVDLHRRAFPASLMTLLGRRFLRRYYGLVFDSVGVLALGAEECGELHGFAVGVLAPPLYRRLLRDAKWRLAAAMAPALLRRPHLLGRVWADFGRTAARSAALGAFGEEFDCELLSLAVGPAARRRGWGRRLTAAFVAEARRAGAAAIGLTTDCDDNAAARRLYERAGFKQRAHFEPYPGRLLCGYLLRLDARTLASAADQDGSPPAAPLLRRVCDVIAGAAGLALCWPLLVATAAAVRLADGGPAFYRHERVGRGGRRFRMRKFRTMRVGADRVGGALTAGGDSRVTGLGRLLRRYKIDELPQLVHLISGRMSLVGPRPESPRYVAPLDGRWQATLSVRPGLTDLASLSYRDEERLLAAAVDAEAYYRAALLPAKLTLSLEGMRRAGPWFELRLVAATARYCLFPSGFDASAVQRRLLSGGGAKRGAQ